MNLETETLHKNAIELARRFHNAESAMIDILQLIDEKKIFLDLGFTSLFDYSVRALKLSESTTSNFITVARKSKTVPELKMAISAGDITVAKARKITPVLTPGNQAHWIGLAKTLPKHKLEKEIAKVMPESATPGRTRYVSETRIELKIGISEVLMEKLKNAQNILSQKLKKSASLEDTLGELVECYLLKRDPVGKAKKIMAAKSAQGSAQGSAKMPIKKVVGVLPPPTPQARAGSPDGISTEKRGCVPGTRYIEATLKHEIRVRDGFQCSHSSTQGERCSNKRWLEIHHKLPLFRGGSNTLENLETLCSAHHKMFHREFLPGQHSSASLL